MAVALHYSFMLPAVPDDLHRADALANERALVSKAQSGDRAALGELFQQFGPELYRSVLLPRLGSDAAARDALSETYAKVIAKIALFSWQPAGFYPWLRTVALRTALDHLRARKRTLVWEASDIERELDRSSTETPIDQKLSSMRDRQAVRSRIENALTEIHPRYATAIRLRILDEQPREEVARALEITPATFDVLLHRALKAMRNALGSTHE